MVSAVTTRGCRADVKSIGGRVGGGSFAFSPQDRLKRNPNLTTVYIRSLQSSVHRLLAKETLCFCNVILAGANQGRRRSGWRGASETAASVPREEGGTHLFFVSIVPLRPCDPPTPPPALGTENGRVNC